MTDTGAAWVSRRQDFRGAANDGIPTLLTDATLTSLTPAPVAGTVLVVDDILVGADAAGYLSLKEETSGTLLCPRIYFPGAGFYQITPRNGIRTFTAAKNSFTPNTPYDMYATTLNALGESIPSNVIQFTTVA